MSNAGLTTHDRGQRLGTRLPQPLRRLARRYTDWNYGWHADIALRYVPVEAALRQAGYLDRPAQALRVLDVGCGSKGGVTSYVDIETVGVDLSFNVVRVARHPRVKPVVGSGLALPVADRAFDMVLCMDTLEHLAPQERRQLASELFRAVREDGMVIAGAPCGPEGRAAELRINERYRARHGRDHPWLGEHLAHPPLTAESLRALMAGAASRFQGNFDLMLAGNTNLELWQRLQSQGALRHLHRLLYRPLWPWMRDRHEAPVYRQVCVVWMAGS
jgi:SAM-dependent methyltransferase